MAMSTRVVSNKKTIEKPIYYIVRQTDHVEAGAGEIALRGGAGYYLDGVGVAIGVYFNYDEADAAFQRVQCEYDDVVLHTQGIRLKSRNGAGATFSCLRVVDGWLGVLEDGGRQSVVKDGISEVALVLQRIAIDSGYGLAAEFASSLLAVSEKTVLGSDLRYFLCAACAKMGRGEGFYFG